MFFSSRLLHEKLIIFSSSVKNRFGHVVHSCFNPRSIFYQNKEKYSSEEINIVSLLSLVLRH